MDVVARLADASSPSLLLGQDPPWWQIIALLVVSLGGVAIVLWRGRNNK